MVIVFGVKIRSFQEWRADKEKVRASMHSSRDPRRTYVAFTSLRGTDLRRLSGSGDMSISSKAAHMHHAFLHGLIF